MVSYPSIYTTIVTFYEHAYHCKNDSLVSHGYFVEPPNSHYATRSEERKRIGNPTTKARVELAARRERERSN
jgi:hypothetical protein